MRKIVTVIVLTTFLLGAGTAQADLHKYNECARQFYSDKRSSELDMIAGVVTFDVFRLFKGGADKRSVYDKIQKTCSHLLSEEDMEFLLERARVELEEMRKLRHGQH